MRNTIIFLASIHSLFVTFMAGCAGPEAVEVSGQDQAQEALFPLSRDDPGSILDAEPSLYPDEATVSRRVVVKDGGSDGYAAVRFRFDRGEAEPAPSKDPSSIPTASDEFEVSSAASPGLMRMHDELQVGADGSGLGTSSEKLVFGTDGRYLISDTTSWPARVFVKLFIDWANGEHGGCSGTLIGERAVLTAGHCVFRNARGGWASSIRVVPGLNGSYMPFGEAWSSLGHTVTGWTEDENDDYDYAVLTLDRRIGQVTGYAGLLSPSDDLLDAMGSVRVAGYPGDKGHVYQWQAGNTVADYDTTMVYHYVDTEAGQSGAGMRPSGGIYADRVFAVHTGSDYFWGSHYNRATRINNTRFNLILGWSRE